MESLNRSNVKKIFNHYRVVISRSGRGIFSYVYDLAINFVNEIYLRLGRKHIIK